MDIYKLMLSVHSTQMDKLHMKIFVLIYCDSHLEGGSVDCLCVSLSYICVYTYFVSVFNMSELIFFYYYYYYYI